MSPPRVPPGHFTALQPGMANGSKVALPSSATGHQLCTEFARPQCWGSGLRWPGLAATAMPAAGRAPTGSLLYFCLSVRSTAVAFGKQQ